MIRPSTERRVALFAAMNPYISELVRRLEDKGEVSSWEMREAHPMFAVEMREATQRLEDAGFIKTVRRMRVHPVDNKRHREVVYLPGDKFALLADLVRLADQIGGFKEVTPNNATSVPEPEAESLPV